MPQKKTSKEKKRCFWCVGSELYEEYHDKEWGRLKLGDQYLFEMLLLEGQQAGLSWLIILKKRDNYRLALDNFDYLKIASYGEEKTQQLLTNPGIVKNRLKIKSIIKNAQVFIEIKEEFSTFKKYLNHFTGGKIYQIKESTEAEDFSADYPTESDLSKAISKDLKKRGMNFVGSKIIFSYLEAVGIYNNHQKSCFLYKNLG